MATAKALLLGLIRRGDDNYNRHEGNGGPTVRSQAPILGDQTFAGLPSEGQQHQPGEGGLGRSDKEKEILKAGGDEEPGAPATPEKKEVVDVDSDNDKEEKGETKRKAPRSPWKAMADAVGLSGLFGKRWSTELPGLTALPPLDAEGELEQGANQGPMTPLLGARGLKRFINAGHHLEEEEPEESWLRGKGPGRRRDLPHLTPGTGGGKGLGKKKGDKARWAVKLARKLAAADWNKLSIQDQFWANSSKRSVESKRSTTLNILEELRGINRQLPLTSGSMKAFSTVLKKAGYSSGDAYLVEAKLLHVEAGYGWDASLDRVFKQCKKALGRGKGKAKKAPEVDETLRTQPTRNSLCRATYNGCKNAVKFGRELFNFAVCWMLREIELAAFTTEDLLFDHTSKKVILQWKVSKTDPEGEGRKRVLQCLCQGVCDKMCPYFIAYDLVKKVEKFNGTNTHLCLTGRKREASKHSLVKEWRKIFGMKTITGHSARRTGALSYIRKGWSIAQVAYLGCWKSNAILGYATEALESMPANLQGHEVYTNRGEVRENHAAEDFKEWKDTLKRELDNFKKSVKEDSKLLKEAANFWENLYNTSGGNLPPKLQSLNSKVTHFNQPTPSASPPVTWRTMCGWHYYGSHFTFVQGEMVVNCAKCVQLNAIRQGGGKAG